MLQQIKEQIKVHHSYKIVSSISSTIRTETGIWGIKVTAKSPTDALNKFMTKYGLLSCRFIESYEYANTIITDSSGKSHYYFIYK